ncbi:hypothetical protein RI367_002705 [Sorochytrium milnesiophthora]
MKRAANGPDGQQRPSTPRSISARIQLTSIRDLDEVDNKGCCTIDSVLAGASGEEEQEEHPGKPLVATLQLNYQIDMSWFLPKVPASAKGGKITIVHGWRADQLDYLAYDKSLGFAGIETVSPPLPIAFGVHHTKAMVLLFADDSIKVVILTANLVEKDWRNKTQAAYTTPFLFPKLVGAAACDFELQLLQYLRAYRDPKVDYWIDLLAKYDFSPCRAVIVGSVPGRFSQTNGDVKRWGHMRLRDVLSRVPMPSLSAFASDAQEYIVAQYSSCGSLGKTPEWLLDAFHRTLGTQLGSSDDDDPAAKRAKFFAPAKRKDPAPTRPPLRIVYPTVRDVRTSYIRPIMHRWVARRAGREQAMPHIKTYTRVVDSRQKDTTLLRWFLVTSANLSKAAWGAAEGKGAVLMIRSYELGVLVHPGLFDEPGGQVYMVNRTAHESLSGDAPALPGDAAAVIPIRLPYDVPLAPYVDNAAAAGDGDDSGSECWTWDKEHKGLDRFGLSCSK